MGLACTRPDTNSVLKFPQKVLLLGDSGAGKTTLLYSWKLGSDSVVEPIPTEDFNVEQIRYNGTFYIIWDLSGAPYYHLRWRQFYHGTNVLVIVIDGSDKKALESFRTEMTTILQERDLNDIPCVVVFNKTDVMGDDTVEETTNIVPTSSNIHVMSCCAKDNSSCKAVLDKINDLSKSC